MRRLLGLALATALCLGLTAESKAQIWISSGNPYGTWSGYYATGYPAPLVGTGVGPTATYYNSGYSGYAPAAATYGYAGYIPAAAAIPAVTTYRYPAAYSYPAYGYGYGVRRGLFGLRMGRTYGGFW